MRILYVETSAYLPSSAHFLEALEARAAAGDGEFLFFDEARFIAPRGSIGDRVARRVVGRPLRGYGELNRALLAAAESFRPDVILIAKGAYFTPATLRALKESTGAALVNYASDDPFNPASSSRNVLEAIPLFDLYLSMRRAAMADIGKAGCPRVEYLMFGYKPELHFPEAPQTEAEHARFDSDVVFIGGCDADRAPYFEYLAHAIPRLRMHLYGAYFDRYPALRKFWRGTANGRDYRLALGGAKIAINLVRRANRDDHVMRTFEIPACGAFMMTERTPAHEELFEENREAVFFSSPAELADQVSEWLGRNSERAKIAAAGHRKIASGVHRYADRLARIVELVSERGETVPAQAQPVAATARPHGGARVSDTVWRKSRDSGGAPDLNDHPATTLDEDWYAIVAGRDAKPFTIGARSRLVAIAVGVIVALNLYAPGGPTMAERALASAIIAGCFLPTWLWMDRLDRSIPFMPFIAVFYAFYYAVPVFLLRKFSTDMFKNPIADHAIALALAYALLGLVCMYAGYYGIVGRALSEVLPRFTLRWRDPRIVKQLCLVFAAFGIFLSSSTIGERVPDAVGELLMYAGDFSLIGICVLIALQLSGKLDLLTTVVLWTILIPLRFFSGISGGSLGIALAVGLTVIVIYATMRRRIPWLVFAVGITFVFILRPIEIPYRMMTTEGGVLSDASTSKRMQALGELLYRATIGGAVSPQVFVEACASRLAQFTIFAAVVDDTPGTVPYWNGKTYVPLITKLIPRVVWPDKPEEMSGQEFGHRYDLISWENRNTSVNLPQLVECYANFGLPGVIVGMFAIGLMYRMLISLYVHPGMGLGALVGAVYVSSKLFDIGTAASMVFGGLPWAIAAMAIFHLVVELAELDTATIASRARAA